MKTKYESLSKNLIIGINKDFGEGAVRDEGALDHIAYETARTRGVNRKAATLLVRIARQHPFFDGNKRTAIESARTYLKLNGREIVAKENTLFDLVFRVISDRYGIDEVTVWIANHTK
ncbi:MAG: Fic family protein [Candidatus Altiarchaeales archaeon]|nr:Fic family protein [Candidatus Altiarchaeota archaeon]MBU4342193.1 Fic family protein [Candidatus Altiarchaeota archaeon]MBU4406192.1 Fic family protein [Candidatus Altiarchaeota archaeon]MBU4437378.1 Fic family protein [Candidatus Altiarchaeota archaeon]MCG2783136.1 Fic family protein [Candidatus Altiarchaeales archaeon]